MSHGNHDMSGRLRERSLRVVMFPDLLSADPYSQLLDRALRRRGIDVERGRSLDARWARAAIGRVDAVHLHWVEFMFWAGGRSRLHRCTSMYAQGLRLMSALQILRDSEVRVIWTVHHLLPRESPYPRLHRLVQRAVLRAADVLIVHSRFAAAQVIERLAPAAPVCVVPHGGYQGVYPRARETRAQTRDRLQLPPASFVYLLFGTVRDYKRVPEAIRAFRELPGADVRLLVAGAPGPANAAVRIAAGGDPRVHLELRSIPDDEVAEIFQAADVLILNYAEVFSSGALLLALALGLPVVAAAASSAVELAPPPATIPFTEGQLLGALADAQLDPEHRRAQARAAGDLPDWDATAEQLEHIYRGSTGTPDVAFLPEAMRA